MNDNTYIQVIAPEAIGSLFTRIALKDQGFLILVLTAAKKSAYGLSPEDLTTLSVWAKEITASGVSSPEINGRL